MNPKQRNKLRERQEEAAMNAASEAFHDDSKNPSSCQVYQEFYGRRCPCEDGWRNFLPKDYED